MTKGIRIYKYKHKQNREAGYNNLISWVYYPPNTLVYNYNGTEVIFSFQELKRVVYKVKKRLSEWQRQFHN